MRLTFVRGAAIAALLQLIMTATPGYAADASVTIDNFTFNPPRITVKAGTVVTWTNQDDIPHTVTEKMRTFKSKTLDTDDKFSFTFTTPGVYDYFCSLHPHMTGTVVVEAAAGDNTK